MKSILLTRLKQLGNDIDNYLDRFEQDEETCEMLTAMFAQDPHYSLYLEALAAKDYKTCREEMHNVKGVTANVGLTCLSQKACEILACIDSGEYSKLDVLNAEFAFIYESTLGILTPAL